MACPWCMGLSIWDTVTASILGPAGPQSQCKAKESLWHRAVEEQAHILPGRLTSFLGVPAAPSAAYKAPATVLGTVPAMTKLSSAHRPGIPEQHGTVEGDSQNLLECQEWIYLKSDNHIVHLIKSSAALAAWSQPLHSSGACGVCNEWQGGSGCRVPALTQPRGDGDKQLCEQ